METEATRTPERLHEDVQLIKDWMSKQPHLPKVEDEKWLATVLYHNKYSLEKSKNKLEQYFTFRTKYPELLKNRDPTGPEISQARASYKMFLADKLTKDGELLAFGQMQSDTSIFDFKSVLKMLFMIYDTTYVENDRHLHLVVITDCRYLSYVHFLKAMPWLKPMVEIFFGAFSERVKALYVINAPAHLDIVFNTIKGLLPAKIVDRFYVYSNMADLCKVVDEDVVCSDLGGKGPSLADYEEYTKKRLEKHRKWFLEQDSVCSIEELRRKTDSKVEDMQGSFRKLEVD